MSTDELVAILPTTWDSEEDLDSHIGWDTCVALMQRIRKLVGGNDELTSLGCEIVSTPEFERVRLILGVAPDLRQLYRMALGWMGPMLAPRLHWECDDTNPRLIRASLTIPEEFDPCPELLFVVYGILRTLPSTVGMDEPAIAAQIAFRNANFDITLEEAPTATLVNGSASTVLGIAQSYTMMISQQQQLIEGYAARMAAVEGLDERSRRLDTFTRTGQRIARQIELPELIQTLLRTMINEFECSGVAIRLQIQNSDQRSWVLGARDGYPECAYDLISNDSVKSQMELWGAPWMLTPDIQDPLDQLTPWISVAIANAIAFRKVSEQHNRIEQQLRQLNLARHTIERSEQRYRSLIEDASDAIVICDLASERFEEVNHSMCTLTGYTREELLTLTPGDLVHPDDVVRAPLDFDPVRADTVVRNERRFIDKSGEMLFVEIIAKKLLDDRMQIVIRDMTKWKQTEEALRESEERYMLAIRGANDGLWDWNLRSGDVHYSPRWKAMLGYAEGEIGTSPDEWFDRVHPDDVGILRREIREHIDGPSETFIVEHRMRHRNGSWKWMLSRGLAVRDEDGVAYRLAGSQADITERKQVEERLLYDAFHDSLTRLPNRAFLINRLEQLLSESNAFGTGFAVLYIDLDRFKVINDSLGHALGDSFLTAAARRIRSALGYGETVARLGGDEFVVLVENIVERGEVERVADMVIDAFQEPFNIEGREIFLSVSVGIAFGRKREYEAPDELMRDADMAMYQAKARGKSCYAIFDETLHERAVQRLQLETDLRRAIERRQLVLHYQPVVALSTGRVYSFEALVRWQHPKHGLMYPGGFIQVAEETGMIHSLGRWVLEEATRQLAEWRRDHEAAHSVRVNVNLSPRQFLRPDIVDEVTGILREAALMPGSVALEITENALMDDSDASIEKLKKLQQNGASVVVDDFGVGYSSFSYLAKLPVDAIKIDRSFVTGMEADATKAKIINMILQLGETLSMKIVAEGVEKPAELSKLRALSCGMVQGNLLSGPVPASEAVKLLNRTW